MGKTVSVSVSLGKKKKNIFYSAEKSPYNFMISSGCYRYLGNVIRKRTFLIITLLRDTSMT